MSYLKAANPKKKKVRTYYTYKRENLPINQLLLENLTYIYTN